MKKKKPHWEIIVEALQKNKTIWYKFEDRWFKVIGTEPTYGALLLNDVVRNPKNYRVKELIESNLDKPSVRVDANPGETERQYRKRGAKTARENRKAERASVKAFLVGLTKIR